MRRRSKVNQEKGQMIRLTKVRPNFNSRSHYLNKDRKKKTFP